VLALAELQGYAAPVTGVHDLRVGTVGVDELAVYDFAIAKGAANPFATRNLNPSHRIPDIHSTVVYHYRLAALGGRPTRHTRGSRRS
jgi:hypothetical protein